MPSEFWGDGAEISRWESFCHNADMHSCVWWFPYGAAMPPDSRMTICKSSSNNTSPWSSASGRSGRTDDHQDPTGYWILRRTRDIDIPSTYGCACVQGTPPNPKTSYYSCSARTYTLSMPDATQLDGLLELCTNQTFLCRIDNGTCGQYFRPEAPKSIQKNMIKTIYKKNNR